MQVWDSFNPFRQIRESKRIEQFGNKITSRYDAQKMRHKIMDEILELEKTRPVYKIGS